MQHDLQCQLGVVMSGVKGKHAWANGIYLLTSKLKNGKKSFVQANNSDRYLYFDDKRTWMVGNCKNFVSGKSRGWLQSLDAVESPEKCSHFKVWCDNEWQSQESIVVAPVGHSVDVAGIHPTIDGTYRPTNEVFNDHCVYRSRSGYYLTFSRKKYWMIQGGKHKGTNTCNVYSKEKLKEYPDQCLDWRVYENGRWKENENARVIRVPSQNNKYIIVKGVQGHNEQTGQSNTWLNGVYTLSSKIINGKPTYFKYTNNLYWLFFDTNRTWMIGSYKNCRKGLSRGWIQSRCANEVSPETVQEWKAFTGVWGIQRSIQMQRYSDAPSPGNVRVSGIHAAKIDGIYRMIPDMIENGRPVYIFRKRYVTNQPAFFLVYSTNNYWMIQSEKNRGSTICNAFSVEKGLEFPEQCFQWKVYSNKKWDESPNARVVRIPRKSAFQVSVVGICTSTTSTNLENSLNGLYNPSMKFVNGRRAYVKASNDFYWLYLDDQEKWLIGSYKNCKRGIAHGWVQSLSKCCPLPSICEAWKVHDGTSWNISPSLKCRIVFNSGIQNATEETDFQEHQTNSAPPLPPSQYQNAFHQMQSTIQNLDVPDAIEIPIAQYADMYTQPHLPESKNVNSSARTMNATDHRDMGKYVEEAVKFLERIKMSQYQDKLFEEGFDSMISLQYITEEDLAQIGMRKGHIRVVLIELKKYLRAQEKKEKEADMANENDRFGVEIKSSNHTDMLVLTLILLDGTALTVDVRRSSTVLECKKEIMAKYNYPTDRQILVLGETQLRNDSAIESYLTLAVGAKIQLILS